MTATWRSTTPDDKLDYRCDLCGAPASTLHFLPWVIRTEEVLFACPKHDPGGYWVTLKRWFEPRERFPEHVAKKRGNDGTDGTLGPLGLLEDRQNALRRSEAEKARR